MTTTKPMPHTRHKRLLKEKGWSYRTAAEELGRHWMHVYRVLNGERKSADLLKRIEAMPKKGAAK